MQKTVILATLVAILLSLAITGVVAQPLATVGGERSNLGPDANWTPGVGPAEEPKQEASKAPVQPEVQPEKAQVTPRVSVDPDDIYAEVPNVKKATKIVLTGQYGNSVQGPRGHSIRGPRGFRGERGPQGLPGKDAVSSSVASAAPATPPPTQNQSQDWSWLWWWLAIWLLVLLVSLLLGRRIWDWLMSLRKPKIKTASNDASWWNGNRQTRVSAKMPLDENPDRQKVRKLWRNASSGSPWFTMDTKPEDIDKRHRVKPGDILEFRVYIDNESGRLLPAEQVVWTDTPPADYRYRANTAVVRIGKETDVRIPDSMAEPVFSEGKGLPLTEVAKLTYIPNWKEVPGIPASRSAFFHYEMQRKDPEAEKECPIPCVEADPEAVKKAEEAAEAAKAEVVRKVAEDEAAAKKQAKVAKAKAAEAKKTEAQPATETTTKKTTKKSANKTDSNGETTNENEDFV